MISANLLRRAFSGCDVLWFAQKPRDFGSFVKGLDQIPKAFSGAGRFFDSARWIASGGRPSDVLTAGWEKNIEGRASGTFTMQVKHDGVLWADFIRPSDMLLVVMSNLDDTEKRSSTVLSLISVDRVSRNRVVDGSGATVFTCSVSGRDLGKVFDSSATVGDPAFMVEDQIFYAQAYNQRLTQAGSFSPSEMVLNIIDILFRPPGDVSNAPSDLVSSQFRFPGAEDVPIASLLDVGTFVQAPTFGYRVPGSFPFAEAGNPWTLMQQYQNACLNEMFIDIRDVTNESLEHRDFQDSLAANFVSSEDAARQKRERKRVWNNLLAFGDPNRHFFSFEGESFGNTIPDPIGPRAVNPSFGGGDDVDRSFTRARINLPGSASPATIALVFRQRPYDTGSFFKLPVHRIDETEIYASDVAAAEHNVFNFFRMTAPTMPASIQEKIFGIMISKQSIARFGLRRKEIETAFPFVGSQFSVDYANGNSSAVDFSAVYQYYVWLVSTWFAFNEEFLEGTMSTHFRPDIRVGNRLAATYRERGHQWDVHYYVQTVRHNYSAQQGQSRSQLVVSRGIDIRSMAVNPAANIFWTKDGRFLPVKDPFDYYVGRLMRKPPNGQSGLFSGPFREDVIPQPRSDFPRILGGQ